MAVLLGRILVDIHRRVFANIVVDLIETTFATDRVDHEVILRAGKFRKSAARLNVRAGCNVQPTALAARVRIESNRSDVFAVEATHVSGRRATISKRKGHGSFGLPRHDVRVDGRTTANAAVI